MANMPMRRMSKSNDSVVVPTIEQVKNPTEWEDRIYEILIDAIQEQANQGERNGNNLTKVGWMAAKAKFRAVSGLNYDDLQIKNMWDTLKRKWSVWYQLFRKETGLGWNYEKNNVEASNDWWNTKFLEDSRVAQFQNKNLKFVLKLTSLFASSTTTGTYDCHNVVSLEKLDTTESAGDSEDPTFGASVGVSIDNCAGVSAPTSFGLGICTLNNTQASVLSGEKSKMDGARVTKEGMQTQQKKLNAYRNGICETVESRSSSPHVSKVKDDDSCGTLNVMKEVKKLPGMTPGSQLLVECSHFLKDPIAWQIFVALGDEESRFNWLLNQINLKKK